MEALEVIGNHRKGIISSFCGTGKTKIFTQLIIDNITETLKVLIVFPSLLLIK